MNKYLSRNLIAFIVVISLIVLAESYGITQKYSNKFDLLFRNLFIIWLGYYLIANARKKWDKLSKNEKKYMLFYNISTFTSFVLLNISIDRGIKPLLIASLVLWVIVFISENLPFINGKRSEIYR